ncbi:hypothetical protein KKG22_00490 [Patescibacteria group bacterium]|nr:hypothetical protein [Patescibacteria group bacterium]MBU1722152.1 hypothetical protein [Patescibacteria group bacterium]MBU1901201.1 hypothetical protein [Patescibacteria group bacterium]
MLNTQYIKKIQKDLHEFAEIRLELIKNCGDALHISKRAIFDMHRGDLNEAKEKISKAEKILKNIYKKYSRNKKVFEEGSYKAAVEEYVEASLFYQFIKTGKIGKVISFSVESEVYLAGLCDVPGELYRYAIRSASEKDYEMVEKCVLGAEEIIGELIEFDFTKYLRVKFDQAKQARNKLEIVQYELSLRQSDRIA